MTTMNPVVTVRPRPSRPLTPADQAGTRSHPTGTATHRSGKAPPPTQPAESRWSSGSAGPGTTSRGERESTGPDRSRGSPGPPRTGVRAARRVRPGRITLDPASTYEVITRQMVDGLRDDVAEIKGRLNGLLWLMAGAIAIDLVMRLAGT